MKQKFIASGIFGALFLLLIVAVKTVAVEAIGAGGTEIGLASLNQAVHNLFGVNMLWYDITDVFGIMAFGIVGIFGLIGLIQLIKRKKLFDVDGDILALGGLYIIVLSLYAGFEKVIINYRPVLMPNCTEPEASFPSSHTMLICVVMGSAVMVLGKYIKDVKLKTVLQAVLLGVIALTVMGRLICGVHWFTDILGGILLSGTLLCLFSGVREKIAQINKK